ncbi:hypothetical protein IHE44_0008466 [Lamprotornis superbus]|uniref:Uncharacterized protein n=1 Tax=Lamprotornis superbus TaxID=245042 RepID=A0A835TVY6_9PASS|nr:hypothetical protein IHE44_0008466 [Lamprotornis superbus]
MELLAKFSATKLSLIIFFFKKRLCSCNSNQDLSDPAAAFLFSLEQITKSPGRATGVKPSLLTVIPNFYRHLDLLLKCCFFGKGGFIPFFGGRMDLSPFFWEGWIYPPFLERVDLSPFFGKDGFIHTFFGEGWIYSHFYWEGWIYPRFLGEGWIYSHFYWEGWIYPPFFGKDGFIHTFFGKDGFIHTFLGRMDLSTLFWQGWISPPFLGRMDLSPFFWGKDGFIHAFLGRMDLSTLFWQGWEFPPYPQAVPCPPVRSPGNLGFKILPPFQTQLQPPSLLSGFSGIPDFEDTLVSPWKNPIPSLFTEFFHLQTFQQSFLPLPFPTSSGSSSFPSRCCPKSTKYSGILLHVILFFNPNFLPAIPWIPSRGQHFFSWVQFQWNKHGLIPEISWLRNFSNPFFPSLPLFQDPFSPNTLRESCSLLSLSIFFPPRFSGRSQLSPHSQSHPNHSGSPTFPPGTPQFSLSLDKSSSSAVLEVIFSSASLNSKERLEKAALELFLGHGFVCLRTGMGGMAGRTRELEDGNRLGINPGNRLGINPGNRLGINPGNRQEPREGAASRNRIQEKTPGAIRSLYAPRQQKSHLCHLTSSSQFIPVHPSSSQFKAANELSGLSNSLIQQCCPKSPGSRSWEYFPFSWTSSLFVAPDKNDFVLHYKKEKKNRKRTPKFHQKTSKFHQKTPKSHQKTPKHHQNPTKIPPKTTKVPPKPPKPHQKTPKSHQKNHQNPTKKYPKPPRKHQKTHRENGLCSFAVRDNKDEHLNPEDKNVEDGSFDYR